MTSAGKVHIVGIGDDGVEGMTAQARRLVEDAEVLVGPDSCAGVLPAPLRDRLLSRSFHPYHPDVRSLAIASGLVASLRREILVD